MSEAALDIATPSGKHSGSENFPVGSALIRRDLRPHVRAYYRWARMSDDIADNPALAPEDKVARLDLMEAVLKFPDGLDTRLSVGGRPLSSSQRMRLVLARAIVGDRRLLLLDESLEGLDLATFQQIEGYLFNQRHPWTLLLVTRDPDLVKHCDQTIHVGECHLGPARPLTTP